MRLEDEIKQSKFQTSYQKLVVNLLYTYNWLEEPTKKVLSKHKLTIPQYNILRILKGSQTKPLSPQDIKKVMLHKKADLTRMLDRLVEKSLVDRNICPSNRRKMDINITQEGLDLLEIVNPKLKAATDDRIAKNITEAEAAMASDIIDKMRG